MIMNKMDILKIVCGFIVSNVIAANFAFAELAYRATFVPVKAGTFLMGSPSDEVGRGDDEIQHKVTLTQDFEIQTTEVTQYQYFAVMGYNPSYFKRKEEHCSLEEHQVIDGTELCLDYPVESVSWEDVQDFISELNKADDGYIYGLPTEAQWEYAARGCVGSGELDLSKLWDMASCTTTAFNLGDNISTDQVNYDGDSSYIRLKNPLLKNTFFERLFNLFSGSVEYRGQTVRVSSLANANDLGLYDMHGNVWEWIEDRYGEYSSSHVVDPKGSTSGRYRVWRGGGLGSKARHMRSANRNGWGPGNHDYDVGLRLMRIAK